MATESLRPRPSRRSVTLAAVWSAPVIATAAATPAASASPNPLADYEWYWSQFQVGSTGNRQGTASTQVNVQNNGTSVVPFTATIVIQFEAFTDAALTIAAGSQTKTFTQGYAGTSGQTSDPLTATVSLTPEQLPPPGATVYVRFTVRSMTATPDAGGAPFIVPRDTAISQPNPSTGQGYLTSS